VQLGGEQEVTRGLVGTTVESYWPAVSEKRAYEWRWEQAAQAQIWLCRRGRQMMSAQRREWDLPTFGNLR